MTGTFDDDGKVRVSNSLVIEVLADGGIRAHHRWTGTPGWPRCPRRSTGSPRRIARAWPCTCAGSSTAPSAVPVAEEVRRLASSLDEAPSEPAPWPKRRSSIQTAAANGLTEQVTDLLDRGVSPNDGQRAADAVPPRDAARTHRRDGRRCAMPERRPRRPRAAGGAARCGRAPRLHAALDLVAVCAVPGARRGRAVRRRIRGRPGVS